MDRKEFKEDLMTLNLYYNYFKSAVEKYENAKVKCRKYLNAENQIGHVEHEVSLSRMHVRNVRKIRENECRQTKKELREYRKLYNNMIEKMYKKYLQKGEC